MSISWNTSQLKEKNTDTTYELNSFQVILSLSFGYITVEVFIEYFRTLYA